MTNQIALSILLATTSYDLAIAKHDRIIEGPGLDLGCYTILYTYISSCSH